MLITGAFAIAVVAMLVVAFDSNRTARAWALVLAAVWVASRIEGYGLDRDLSLTFGEVTDAVLALIALLSFTFAQAPWWVLALSLTWIAQIFAHWDLADDIPTMGLWLNLLCGAQIALVCSDRVADAIATWTRPLRYSHSRVSRASRLATRASGGPDCRPGALRRAAQRLEKGSA